MELLKGAVTAEIWEKMEETVVQTQGSLHCFLGLGLLSDPDGGGTTFLQNQTTCLRIPDDSSLELDSLNEGI
jgi:hypothetical protein